MDVGFQVQEGKGGKQIMTRHGLLLLLIQAGFQVAVLFQLKQLVREGLNKSQNQLLSARNSQKRGSGNMNWLGIKAISNSSHSHINHTL